MTFEELENIAAEQNKRIFRLESQIVFNALPAFTGEHFRAMKLTYITSAALELMMNIKFPFEQLITSVDHVHSVSNKTGKTHVITGVAISFSVTILNRPLTSVQDIAVLTAAFFGQYGSFLIRNFKLPLELKNVSMILDLKKEHALYEGIMKNNSF